MCLKIILIRKNDKYLNSKINNKITRQFMSTKTFPTRTDGWIINGAQVDMHVEETFEQVGVT